MTIITVYLQRYKENDVYYIKDTFHTLRQSIYPLQTTCIKHLHLTLKGPLKQIYMYRSIYIGLSFTTQVSSPCTTTEVV